MSLYTTQVNFEDWILRVRPATSPGGRTLLLLHGWTGDENSMWPFTRNIPHNRWLLAPRGIYEANPKGYSWRIPTRVPVLELDSLRESADRLVDLLKHWGIANAVNTDVVDVIGFSQGGAMAAALTLFYPQKVVRLGVLAGFVPAVSEQMIQSQPLQGKSVFWAHGTLDDLVPIEMGRAGVQTLQTCGAQVEYVESEIAHKLSAEGLRRLEQYLA